MKRSSGSFSSNRLSIHRLNTAKFRSYWYVEKILSQIKALVSSTQFSSTRLLLIIQVILRPYTCTCNIGGNCFISHYKFTSTCTCKPIIFQIGRSTSLLYFSPLFCLITCIAPLANILNPDETPRNSTSHSNSSCLTLGQHSYQLRYYT